MKKFDLLLLGIFSLCMATSAQTANFSEPEFIGEVLTIPDSSIVQLAKETIMMCTRVNASVFGIGKAKTKLIIDSPRAEVRLKTGDEIYFIVKATDNRTDPMAIINIFAFEATEKRRLAETASISSFGSVKSNKLDRLEYSAKKFGENSYIIHLEEKPTGEFGITISNPNNKDEKRMIVSTFAIDE